MDAPKILLKIKCGTAFSFSKCSFMGSYGQNKVICYCSGHERGGIVAGNSQCLLSPYTVLCTGLRCLKCVLSLNPQTSPTREVLFLFLLHRLWDKDQSTCDFPKLTGDGEMTAALVLFPTACLQPSPSIAVT